MSWFTESNRWKHFVLAILAATFGTMLFATGCGTGMEFKDCHHDPENAGKPIWRWSWKNWDWLDWLATFLGGLVGQAIQLFVIYLIFIYNG